jgi:hypothetical protein
MPLFHTRLLSELVDWSDKRSSRLLASVAPVDEKLALPATLWSAIGFRKCSASALVRIASVISSSINEIALLILSSMRTDCWICATLTLDFCSLLNIRVGQRIQKQIDCFLSLELSAATT